MTKILSDSLIVSKTGAPLDARTEVNSLSEIGSVQNPTESLIIYDKETKMHYKVASMKDEQIAGTTIMKKVIASVEPLVADGDGTSMMGYEELGDADLDDLFDQAGVAVTEVSDAPDVDFDTLE